MDKAYNPQQVEDKIYEDWEKSGFFNPDKVKDQKSGIKDNRKRKAFSIMMPPPNVTGTLHVGHAVMLALQDIMARYHRMKGEDTLWLPGTDHAAIATQTKVEKILKERTGQSRHDLGREKFLEEVKKFAAESKATIHKQIRKMGSSCDWSREAYTLDEIRERAVREVFKKMYDDGLIYRGYRIVNWCPRCSSTLADDEVEHKQEDGKLYYIRYILNPKSEIRNLKSVPSGHLPKGDKIQNLESITVATTRPETKLGDTAVAVNPNDARYKKYIGKEFDVDLAGHKIHIRFIADKAIDPKFGTGAVGVTPAHSMIDWEMAEKNKLPFIKVIDEDGTMSPFAGRYVHLPIFEARRVFVNDLRQAGLLEKIEDCKHNVGHCYRCSTLVEQLPSKQWFVSVNKKILPLRGITRGVTGKTLKELAIEAVKSGKIKIIPERFNKVYFEWMKNLRDWCISRQIWFGHRLPVWHRKKSEIRNPKSLPADAAHQALQAGETNPKSKICPFGTSPEGRQNPKTWLDEEEIYVGVEPPIGEEWKQETDTLDTWFSSGLWTFSTLLSPCGRSPEGGDKDYKKYKTLGEWIKKSPDLKRFHPTSVMETGYDIIFFWVARMILMTTYVLGEIPFKTVYLHGLVRDEKGRKMSKSLGNVIDPLTVAEKYGTDAVRLSLVLGTTAGNDTALSEEKIAGFRNFTNKLWNIGRYILGNSKFEIRNPKQPPLSPPISPRAKQGELEGVKISPYGGSPEGRQNLTLAEKWILSRLNSVIAEVTSDLENFRFSQAGEKLRAFTWEEFADWYIEISKIEKNFQQLSTINYQLLKLWHPFMPFVTEHLYSLIKSESEANKNEFLMMSEWPKADKKLIDKKAEKEFENLRKIIIKMRNMRAEHGVPPPETTSFYLDGKNVKFLEENIEILKKLTRGNIQITKSKSAVIQIRMAASVFSQEKEKSRLELEKNNLEKYLSGLRAKLANHDFVSRAPKEIVEGERNKLKEIEEKVKNLDGALKHLKE